jgi:cystathionine beta-lyase
MTDFEKKYYYDRRGTGCAKWDGLEHMFGRSDLIALWVADMDFRCPDSVRAAMTKLAEANTYGYSFPAKEYFSAFIGWEKKRHGYNVEQDWIRHTPGVVSGIYRFIGALTEKNDACIILSPCYYPFMNAVKDTGRRLVCSMLKNDKGYYTPDYEDFENKIVKENVKLFVLCSPHNPVGRVWKKEELAKLLEICEKHGVYVISDEIHQDLTLGGNRHITAANAYSCGKFAVTLTAASKTFNLAGLSHSFAIVPDKDIRKKFDDYCEPYHSGLANTGYIAIQAAYEGGEAWLDGCLLTIEKNAEYLRDTLKAKLPEAVVSPLEGTYLQWIDLAAYTTPDNIKAIVQEKCGLAVDYGNWFYTPEEGKSDCHIRMNLATSFDNIKTAVDRLAEAMKNK